MSEFEQLVEQACRKRVIQYSRAHEGDVTLQFGRVLYATSRERAEVLLRKVLCHDAQDGGFEPRDPGAGSELEVQQAQRKYVRSA
ncbi:MAG TPA: hypothetical protein VFG50_11475 [Rhodothermales bacterium]|nr:hypothetical protein [Rhodothermales bacterium]